MIESETGESLQAKDHPAWEPEWLRGRFTAQMKCSHCGDPTTIVGSYKLQEVPSTNYDRLDYFSLYTIEAVLPAPRLIHVPAELPDTVAEQVDRAFVLFWLDGGACANAIRGAVEMLLDHLKVRKTDDTRTRRGRLSLHRRIELFTESEAHLGEVLMAVKWIGNAGSHAADVPIEALFDGFDMLEHVLQEVFESPSQHAARIARRINRTRGPK